MCWTADGAQAVCAEGASRPGHEDRETRSFSCFCPLVRFGFGIGSLTGPCTAARQTLCSVLGGFAAPELGVFTVAACMPQPALGNT